MLEITKQKTNSPKPFPSSGDLGFGQYFSDHLFCADYKPQKGWHNCRISPYEAFRLDPAASVLHYGQALFEGLKAYRGEDGKIRLFRPEMNHKRMVNGAKRLCMEAPPLEVFIEGLKELVRFDQRWVPQNPNQSLYLRPTLIGTQPFLGVRPSDEYLFYIITSPVGGYYSGAKETISIWIEGEYSRAATGGVGEAKTGGNYSSSLLAAKKAKERGYFQVLWLDAAEKKYIEEVGTMNIFFVIDDQLITPPLGGNILPGVTRDSVIGLAKDFGMAVKEKKISIQELLEASTSGHLQEAFGTGTAAVISPIGRFQYKDQSIVINQERKGEVTTKLHQELLSIQYGTSPKKPDWVTIL